MSYHKIVRYLKSKGLTDGEAHYVRNLIRQLVDERVQKAIIGNTDPWEIEPWEIEP